MIVNLITLAAVILHAISAGVRVREAARHSDIMTAVINGSGKQQSQLQERLLTLKTAGRVTMNFSVPYLLMLSQKIFLYRFITMEDMLALTYFVGPIVQLLLILGENQHLLERLKGWSANVLAMGRNRVEPLGRVHCFTLPLDDVVVIELEEIGGS